MTEPERTGPEARIAEVLAATETLFLRHGYAGASMSEIAQSCGMSKKTLYTLFDGKEALFAAMIRDTPVTADYTRIAQQGATLRDQLRRLLEQIAVHRLNPRNVMVLRLLITDPGLNARLQGSYLRDGIDQSRKALVALIASAMEAGLVAPGNPQTIASMLFGGTIGTHLLLATTGVPLPDPTETAQRINAALDVWPGAEAGARAFPVSASSG